MPFGPVVFSFFFPKKNKPGHRGTGSAFTARAASTARKARAARAARTGRARAPAPRGAAPQERQEQRELPNGNPIRLFMPLLGRCAASPGGLSWERFACFLAVSLRAFRRDLREPLKSMQAESPEVPRKTKQNGGQEEPRLRSRRPRACGRNCFECLPKMVRKCSPEAPKSLQNGSRRPPGGHPKPILT